MVNPSNIVRLLSLPVIWMGIVQMCFGMLSFAVFQDNIGKAVMEPAVFLIVIASILLYRLKKNDVSNVSYRDSLMFASLTWVLTGIMGGVPIMLITDISFTDAVFELDLRSES